MDSKMQLKSLLGNEPWSEKDSILSFDGTELEEQQPLFVTGYRRASPVTQFEGRCMLCHAVSTLALLIRTPPPVETAQFPGEGQGARVAFPLAVGNYPEMDVLSFFVACDACAARLVELGTCPTSDVIVGAICLVCLPENQAALLEAVDQAVRGRFNVTDLLAVCVAIVDAKLVQNEARQADPEEKDLFRRCAQWTLRALAGILEVPATLSPSFGPGPMSGPMSGPGSVPAPMQRIHSLFAASQFSDPGHVDNADLLMLRYPVAGFMVLVRLMRLAIFPGRPQSAIQTLLFQRLVFHVLEAEFAKRAAGRPPLAVADMLELRRGGPRDDDRSAASTASGAGPKTSIAISELSHYGALDRETLRCLRTEAEFASTEKSAGPALAVFLHWLAHSGLPFPSPVSCFNALKTSALTKNVILAPMAISDGLAADLITKIQGR